MQLHKTGNCGMHAIAIPKALAARAGVAIGRSKVHPSRSLLSHAAMDKAGECHHASTKLSRSAALKPLPITSIISASKSNVYGTAAIPLIPLTVLSFLAAVGPSAAEELAARTTGAVFITQLAQATASLVPAAFQIVGGIAEGTILGFVTIFISICAVFDDDWLLNILFLFSSAIMVYNLMFAIPKN